MLIANYLTLKDRIMFKDLGAEYYNRFIKEGKINAYLKSWKNLTRNPW